MVMRRMLKNIASRPVLFLACVLVVSLVAVLFPNPADAALFNPDKVIYTLLDTFNTGAKFWQETLSTLAKRLFWLLVSIELAWMGISMALRGADLGEWLQEITSQVFFVGFFYFLLFNASQIFSAIINSFTGAGQQVASNAGISISGTLASQSAGTGKDLGGIDPVAIFNLGWQTAKALVAQTSTSYIVVSILLLIAALVVVVTFSFLCCMMIMALLESYIVMNAAVFFMGFGGSNWTKDYATKMLRLAVSIGAKLFIMMLLALLAVGLVDQIGKMQLVNCQYSKITAPSRIPFGPLGERLSITESEYQQARSSSQSSVANTGNYFTLDREQYNKSCEAPEGAVRQIFMLIAACIIVWMLLKGVPNMLQGVLMGVAGTSGAEAYASSWVPTPQKVAGVAAGVGLVEAPMLAGRTLRLGYNEARSGGAGRLSAGGQAAFRGLIGLGKEIGATIGDKMTGRDSNPDKGRFVGRLGRGMGERLADQKTLDQTGVKGTSRHKWAPPHDTKPKPSSK